MGTLIHDRCHLCMFSKDWLIGGGALATAIGIYMYTIFAIQQEKFLDDFDMPDPLEEPVQKPKMI